MITVCSGEKGLIKKKTYSTSSTSRLKNLLLFMVCLSALFAGCELGTGPVEVLPNARSVLETMEGVWYSHDEGLRTDGYRIGKWKDRRKLLPQAKRGLFPGFDIDAPQFRSYSGAAYNAANDFPEGLDEEYFVFYDDTVFGQSDDGSGGNNGWGDKRYRYMGIVKAVNIFDAAGENTGAVIIQYLNHCYPNWDSDFAGTPPMSFFGVYYQILSQDVITMANPVHLANLWAGKKYYTETATLQEAIDKNTAANKKEFIAGVALPQDREQ
jgi:hypothetical protein